MVISAGGRGLSGRYYMLLYYLAGLLEKAEKICLYAKESQYFKWNCIKLAKNMGCQSGEPTL